MPPSHRNQAGKRRKKYKPPQPPLWGAFFLRLPEGLRRAPFEGGWWVLLTDNSIMNYELRITNYHACSKASVLVHWSHTSLGPQYWIGPG